MIYFIRGILSELKSDSVIIDVNGIGYQVICPESTLNQLPNSGVEIKLHTYHHIREDQHLLFGFTTLADRDFFIVLTSVSGVGPKLGIKILSALPAAHLTQAIIQSNLVQLTQISGVGKKMAERMIIELKDKLTELYGHTGISESAIHPPTQPFTDDLILACKSLGYSYNEIKQGIQKAGSLLSQTQTLESNIKVLLKQL
jgi:Holliday junction DNA helicase RuvA